MASGQSTSLVLPHFGVFGAGKSSIVWAPPVQFGNSWLNILVGATGTERVTGKRSAVPLPEQLELECGLQPSGPRADVGREKVSLTSVYEDRPCVGRYKWDGEQV